MNEVVEHYQRTRSSNVTAAHYDVSATTVLNWARKAGVPIRTTRKLTDSDVDEVVGLYRQGVGGHKLERRFEVHRRAIYDWLRKRGVTIRSHLGSGGYSEQTKADARRLRYAHGMTQADVARHVGASVASVRKWIERREDGTQTSAQRRAD